MKWTATNEKREWKEKKEHKSQIVVWCKKNIYQRKKGKNSRKVVQRSQKSCLVRDKMIKNGKQNDGS